MAKVVVIVVACLVIAGWVTEAWAQAGSLFRKPTPETARAPGRRLGAGLGIAPDQEIQAEPTARRFFVKKILLSGNHAIATRRLEQITNRYAMMQLSFVELQLIASQITNLYRTEGFITSVAYIPPQKIVDGVVKLVISEGSVGEVTVKGNRYFADSIFTEPVESEVGAGIFDYRQLQRALRGLNLNPDRHVRAVLTPGRERGTTDVALDVTDRSPWHFGAYTNRRGTRNTGRDRWGAFVRNSNFLGVDDILTVNFQHSLRNSSLRAMSVDYNVPLPDSDIRVGAYFGRTRTDIRRRLKNLEPEGETRVLGLYATKPLLDEHHFTINGSIGFDRKSSEYDLLRMLSSQDKVSVLKFGTTLDRIDQSGRFFFTNELHVGTKWFSATDENDPEASRFDASSEFYKLVSNLTRVQRIYWSETRSMYLLLKGQMQLADDKLLQMEQMAIGGADTVRGYPELEAFGDYGYVLSAELRLPSTFIIPDTWYLPYCDTPLCDQVQFVIFLDTGQIYLTDPLVGEQLTVSLTGAGVGLRFELSDLFNAVFDWGFPLDQKPSDGSGSAVHCSLSLRF